MRFTGGGTRASSASSISMDMQAVTAQSGDFDATIELIQ